MVKIVNKNGKKYLVGTSSDLGVLSGRKKISASLAKTLMKTSQQSIGIEPAPFWELDGDMESIEDSQGSDSDVTEAQISTEWDSAPSSFLNRNTGDYEYEQDIISEIKSGALGNEEEVKDEMISRFGEVPYFVNRFFCKSGLYL